MRGPRLPCLRRVGDQAVKGKARQASKMSSKQQDERSWMVALVPLFSVGGMSQPRWEEAILISDAEARSAILQALGSSPGKRNLRDEMPRIGRLEYQIRVHKRPLKKIADAEGITVAALKKRLQRFRKRERPSKEEIARREEEVARRMKAGKIGFSTGRQLSSPVSRDAVAFSNACRREPTASIWRWP